jgi:hypothetical protein
MASTAAAMSATRLLARARAIALMTTPERRSTATELLPGWPVSLSVAVSDQF